MLTFIAHTHTHIHTCTLKHTYIRMYVKTHHMPPLSLSQTLRLSCSGRNGDISQTTVKTNKSKHTHAHTCITMFMCVMCARATSINTSNLNELKVTTFRIHYLAEHPTLTILAHRQNTYQKLCLYSLNRHSNRRARGISHERNMRSKIR